VAAGVLLLLLTSNALAASRLNKTAQDSRLVGRVAQAIDTAMRATAADAGRAEYWHTLGLAYVAAARWREATTALDRASALAPYDVPYMNDAMAAQFALGASDSKARALALADQAVRVDPNNPRAHLMRATAMQATGNLPEALRSAERALVLDPASSNPGLYLTTAQIYRASGRTAGAVVIARQGLLIFGRSPQSVGLRLELARALVAAGQPRDALAELDIALAIQPNDPSIQRLRDEIRGGIPQ
jgi:tetratricopeptide (TPR) repeat protein